MEQEAKYVNFARLALKKSSCVNMSLTDDYSLVLTASEGGCITKMFDTKDEGHTFNRLVFDGENINASLEIIVAATDHKEYNINGKDVMLDGWLARDVSTFEEHKEKGAVLRELSYIRKVNVKDFLLYFTKTDERENFEEGIKGQYVWIYVAFNASCAEGYSCRINGMKLELPKYTFREYFPEIYNYECYPSIYKGNDFFDRYIAVFQSVFLGIESRADRIPEMLDYLTTPDDKVEMLADWLGIENMRRHLDTQKIKQYIKNIDLFQGLKGTKKALEGIIELYTGLKPRIIEYFEWANPKFSKRQLELNKKTYGDTPDCFCVLLQVLDNNLPITKQDLESVIAKYSVLGLRFKVIYLETSDNLDLNSYLDVNFMPSVPTVALLDKGSIGDNMIIE